MRYMETSIKEPPAARRPGGALSQQLLVKDLPHHLLPEERHLVLKGTTVLYTLVCSTTAFRCHKYNNAHVLYISFTVLHHAHDSFFFFFLRFIIISKYTVAVFRCTRRGHQISLQMVVSHHVVAGI
jgi:hypothetical protein